MKRYLVRVIVTSAGILIAVWIGSPLIGFLLGWVWPTNIWVDYE